jgi:hypothetical protein
MKEVEIKPQLYNRSFFSANVNFGCAPMMNT